MQHHPVLTRSAVALAVGWLAAWLVASPVVAHEGGRTMRSSATASPDISFLTTTVEARDVIGTVEGMDAIEAFTATDAYMMLRKSFHARGCTPTGLSAFGLVQADGSVIDAVGEAWSMGDSEVVAHLVGFRQAGRWIVYADIARISPVKGGVLVDVQLELPSATGTTVVPVASGFASDDEIASAFGTSVPGVNGIVVAPDLPGDVVPFSAFRCNICRGACGLVQAIGCGLGAYAICVLAGFASGSVAGVVCGAAVSFICRFGLSTIRSTSCTTLCTRGGYCP